jgi:hypothetical protein
LAQALPDVPPEEELEALRVPVDPATLPPVEPVAEEPALPFTDI